MTVLLTLVPSITKIQCMESSVSIDYSTNAFSTAYSVSSIDITSLLPVINQLDNTHISLCHFLTALFLTPSSRNFDPLESLLTNSTNGLLSCINLMDPMDEKICTENQLKNQSLSSDVQQPSFYGEPHIKPVNGVLTQDFHPGHIGVDTGVPVGTPVISSMDGKVVFAGWNMEGYGNLIVIENGMYKTYYAHLSNFEVKEGDTITTGNVVGLSGITGNSSGPHLHYEVRVNGNPVNPTKYYGRAVHAQTSLLWKTNHTGNEKNNIQI